MSSAIWIMIGTVLGFVVLFVVGMCKAAGGADRQMEEMMHNIKKENENNGK